MRKPLLAAAALVLGATFALGSPSFAQAADPTMNQVYEAAAAGHLDQAQQMITQVLEHHPNSAKAHYVQAELFAKEGKTALARAELGSAERLNPGLTEFSAALGSRTQRAARPDLRRAFHEPADRVCAARPRRISPGADCSWA